MWIGEDEIKNGIVSVKSLSFHEQVDIDVKELVPRLQELIKANPVLLTKEQQEEHKKNPSAFAHTEETCGSEANTKALASLYEIRNGFYEAISDACNNAE